MGKQFTLYCASQPIDIFGTGQMTVGDGESMGKPNEIILLKI